MKRGFIGRISSALDLQESINRLGVAGVGIAQISVNRSFEDFVSTLEGGDTAVVVSYVDVVGSLRELFSLTLKLSERNILIESLEEPHLNFLSDHSVVTRDLGRLDSSLRRFRTRQGLDKARAQGRVLGRPLGAKTISEGSMQQAVSLYVESNLTVDKICDLSGVNPRALYRHIKLEGIAYRTHLPSAL